MPKRCNYSIRHIQFSNNNNHVCILLVENGKLVVLKQFSNTHVPYIPCACTTYTCISITVTGKLDRDVFLNAILNLPSTRLRQLHLKSEFLHWFSRIRWVVEKVNWDKKKNNLRSMWILDAFVLRLFHNIIMVNGM